MSHRRLVLARVAVCFSLAAVAAAGCVSRVRSPDAGADAGTGVTRDGPPPNRLPTWGDGGAPPPTYTCNQNTQKTFPVSYTCTGAPGPWGEALQKALWFFHANRCGAQESCPYMQWRGPDHLDDARIKLISGDPNGVDMSAAFIAAHRDVLDPDGDGTIDVSGGFHDAGDYIKFGLTTAYAASMLAWSYVEFPDAYRTTGLEPELFYLLRAFGEYLARNTYTDGDGALVAYAEQVSDATDHTCGWMPPEVRKITFCPRKAYFVTSERPAADVTAAAAATLAELAIIFRSSEPDFSETCLAKAKALYDFAAAHPTAISSANDGLYTSEYAWDDLAWAALWLADATGDDTYLKAAFDERTTGQFSGWVVSFPGFHAAFDGAGWSESHTHCWNSVRSGVFLRLAGIYDQRVFDGNLPATSFEAKAAKKFADIAYEDSAKWPSYTQTAGGFNLINSWGSGRYNSAAQYVALVFNKYFPSRSAALVTWAREQMDYLLGDNPLGQSYVMGFTTNYASHPHHAAGHASIYGELDNPVENRHVIWGALVNGPSDLSDSHSDLRSDFGANEVTIDYNASQVAALSAHWALRGQGQCPLRDFPPLEPPIDEFYTRTRINSDGACNSQVEITLINETIHAPRYDHNISARYYFDAAELIARGVNPSTMQASIVYDRGATEFGEPTRLGPITPCAEDSTIYYVELGYEGYDYWGEIVKVKAPRTTQIQIGVPYGGTCVWDPSNDWSHTGLTTTSLKTEWVPVYRAGNLIFGKQPSECPGAPPVPIPTVP